MSGEAAENARQAYSEAVGQRVRRAFELLEERYGSGLPELKRDMLLAHYVYGLMAVLLAGEAPVRHLKAIESHLKEIIPAERAARALQAVPEEGDAWLESTLASIEAIGGKHGEALLAQGIAATQFKPFSNKNALTTGSAEPVLNARDAQEEILTR
ncbi:hypothetical protein [Phyllobacterium salinisoli]|nr:hypothetical protein [Phyllobacterium salinisoli]